MSAVYQAGDRCVFCGESTAVGSGRFVNRIPALTTADQAPWLPTEMQTADLDVDGYACAECMSPGDEDVCRCGVCIDCDGFATHHPDSKQPDWCDWCATGHGQEEIA
jgi:hypothetical protein